MAAAVVLAEAELAAAGKFAYLRSKFHYPLQILKFARVLDCMRRKALSHATSNVVGVRRLLRGEGSDFVIQASSPLTKKQNFKFLKNYFCKF